MNNRTLDKDLAKAHVNPHGVTTKGLATSLAIVEKLSCSCAFEHIIALRSDGGNEQFVIVVWNGHIVLHCGAK